MPDGSEFQTQSAATLKLWVAKVVQTRGTDNSFYYFYHFVYPQLVFMICTRIQLHYRKFDV